jgi:hypothetical protein
MNSPDIPLQATFAAEKIPLQFRCNSAAGGSAESASSY